MTKYYLRIEGVNLGNFVYDTQDLSTIRGSGLAILESVSHFDGKTIAGFQLKKVSTGASAGIFEFDVPDVSIFNQKEFCQAIRDELNAQGNAFRYATFVIDVLPSSGDLATDFHLDRESLLAKNRWRQMQSPRFALPLRNENGLVCEVDMISPAKTLKENIKGELKFVSEGVFQRREFGKTQKQRFIKKELEEFNKNLLENERAFDLEQLKDKKFVKDFDSLSANLNKPENINNKIAVIYLDGNDFGKTQKDLDIQKLQDFDAKKNNFQRNWLARLMDKVVVEKDWHFQGNNQIRYQLEILLWGGDEILLVVPAWKGWEVVEHFYQHQFIWNNHNLTHSLGIVFCHHNAPIRRIKALAESLAGLAKDKSREHNYFAYEILESFDHISKDLEQHRKSRCPQNGSPDDKDLILDGNQISQITTAIKEFKKFMPKRKLNQIVQKLLSTDKYADGLSLIADVKSELNKDSELASLANLLNGYQMFWAHALALWDFIGEKN